VAHYRDKLPTMIDSTTATEHSITDSECVDDAAMTRPSLMDFCGVSAPTYTTTTQLCVMITCHIIRAAAAT